MTATTTQRGAAMKARRRAAGLKRLDLWVHPEDEDAIKREAERLAAIRGNGNIKGEIKCTII